MRAKRKANGAIIRVNDKVLLQFLQFEGGYIHKAFKEDGVWEPDYTSFVIEHKDLPEVDPGEPLSSVIPFYAYHYDKNGKLIGVERTYPPRRNK